MAKFINNAGPADLAVCGEARSFLQSDLWGLFKARFGWKAGAFLVDWEGGGRTPLLVLGRSLLPGLSFAYVPWGPELPAGFDAAPGGALAELAAALKPLLPRNTAFIRFDPPWYAGEDEAVAGAINAADPVNAAGPETGGAAASLCEIGSPFVRAPADVQPPDTVLVDLGPSESAILAAMKPKWRYNIGLAGKRGVTVSRRDGEGLDAFYALLAETALRDGIAVHSPEYYRTLFEVMNGAAGGGKPGDGLRLYLAKHEGDTLAAIVTLFRGTGATYLYGASSNTKRNLMAPYALQWQAMRDAKAAGCGFYDLFGIPPSDDPSHPMRGLYRFKTGFGGRIVHRPGSWDYPCKPLACALFRTAEGIRKKHRDKRKKKNRGEQHES
ncbi:MAG: peptidoglycan bridge formation glycyltransferase FemA/FemB family protein [Treponema sp.]|jgi:lipid II:glycine glycyltransferase (peptidoglycan interpeptide bridge formation enzyme)|nr:peptidoglycan bridge formation glycyltransferase FemA/FemB family protein [Treponema sp.]